MTSVFPTRVVSTELGFDAVYPSLCADACGNGLALAVVRCVVTRKGRNHIMKSFKVGKRCLNLVEEWITPLKNFALIEH